MGYSTAVVLESAQVEIELFVCSLNIIIEQIFMSKVS